jgi:hypothetical protein
MKHIVTKGQFKKLMNEQAKNLMNIQFKKLVNEQVKKLIKENEKRNELIRTIQTHVKQAGGEIDMDWTIDDDSNLTIDTLYPDGYSYHEYKLKMSGDEDPIHAARHDAFLDYFLNHQDDEKYQDEIDRLEDEMGVLASEKENSKYEYTHDGFVDYRDADIDTLENIIWGLEQM